LVGDLDIVDCQARAAVLVERIPAARLEVLPGTATCPTLRPISAAWQPSPPFLSEI
jgi:hypothetical protein